MQNNNNNKLHKIPVWLDCDPGHDDAVAILILCFHPAFDLKGISTSYGNAEPDRTDYNARSLLTALGMGGSVAVYRGAQKPWVRVPSYAPYIHGTSGLDGSDLLPEPCFEDAVDVDFVEAVRRAAVESHGELVFVSTGPLTSFATLLRDDPEVMEYIRFVSVMGGGFDGVGNKNANMSAEFNIWSDPHAANYVFNHERVRGKLVLCPLNMTHEVIATDKVMQRIRYGDDSAEDKGSKKGTKLRSMFYQLFMFFKKTYMNNMGFKEGPPIHDPTTLIPLLDLTGWANCGSQDFNFRRPLCTYHETNITVVDDLDSLDSGMCVAEPCNSGDSNPEDRCPFDCYVIVCDHIDVNYFWEQVFYCLREAEKHSTIETPSTCAEEEK